jgi:hypothetical protein
MNAWRVLIASSGWHHQQCTGGARGSPQATVPRGGHRAWLTGAWLLQLLHPLRIYRRCSRYGPYRVRHDAPGRRLINSQAVAAASMMGPALAQDRVAVSLGITYPHSLNVACCNRQSSIRVSATVQHVGLISDSDCVMTQSCNVHTPSINSLSHLMSPPGQRCLQAHHIQVERPFHVPPTTTRAS